MYDFHQVNKIFITKLTANLFSQTRQQKQICYKMHFSTIKYPFSIMGLFIMMEKYPEDFG